MKQIFTILFCCILFALSGLKAQNAGQPLGQAEKTFEYIWQVFANKYSLFEQKKCDWQALYHVYRPKINSKTSEDDLYMIVSQMLSHLNDNHVMIMTQNPTRFFNSGYLGQRFKDGGV